MTLTHTNALLERIDREAPEVRKNTASCPITGQWFVWVFLHGDQDAVRIDSAAQWEALKVTDLHGRTDGRS